MYDKRFAGVVVKWFTPINRPKFGFAITAEGQEIYFSEYAFLRKDELQRIGIGSEISFTLPKTLHDRFVERLNAGHYRDAGLSHRNPRPPLDDMAQHQRAAKVRLEEDHPLREGEFVECVVKG